MSLHLRLRISPFRIPVVGASTRNAFSSRSLILFTDADHCNDLFGLRKSVPAWRFLLLRDDTHRVLVVFLEANGIVEDAAENRPALVDARCGKPSSRRSTRKLRTASGVISRAFFVLNRARTRGVLYSNLLRVRLP